MGKRTVVLHLDLAGLDGDLITESLLAQRDALKAQGFKVPAKKSGESLRAAIEMTRTHKEHGLKRKHVEGAWSMLCRQAHKGSKTPLLSVPGLGACTDDQVDLVLDGLHGLRATVVMTVPAGQAQAPEIAAAVHRWRTRLKKGRLHVIEVSPDNWEAAWSAYVDIAGIEAKSLTQAPRQVA